MRVIEMAVGCHYVGRWLIRRRPLLDAGFQDRTGYQPVVF